MESILAMMTNKYICMYIHGQKKMKLFTSKSQSHDFFLPFIQVTPEIIYLVSQKENSLDPWQKLRHTRDQQINEWMIK